MATQPPRPTEILRLGASGEEVQRLQRLLADAGFEQYDDEGLFGESTEAAVRELQKERGLPGDGIVGASTWSSLEEAAIPPRRGAVKGTARARRPPRERLSAAEFVRAEFTEISDGAEDLRLPPTPPGAERLPMSRWLDRILPLFISDQARFLSIPNAAVRIWGAALLDAALAKQLAQQGALQKVLGHFGDDPESVLSEPGRERWVRLKRLLERKDTAAPTLLDRPALVDQLNRRAFAIALAARLVQVRATYAPRGLLPRLRAELKFLLARLRLALPPFLVGRSPSPLNEGPFLVHLHGPWGAGKTSLLNFFAEELRRPSEVLHEAVWGPEYKSCPSVRPWIVVDFNAWQHQRVAPPWWWLMTALYQHGARELPFHRRWLFRLRDHWWRLCYRWPAYVIPAVALVAIGSLVWYMATRTSLFETPTDGKPWYEHVGAVATALSAAIAFGITLWTGVRAVKTWVLVGSARGAETFLTTASDPLAFVQRRYERLVRSLGRPLAIVVDDLDRCKTAYVVELLEGIQTLFSKAPVTYVVAADRSWLRESFAKEYDQFKEIADDPGRPFGDRFLEKNFQLSTSVPRLGGTARRAYLGHLLVPADGDVGGGRMEHDEPTEQARALASEQEIRVAVQQSSALPAAEQAKVRAALVVRASAADIVEQTEYLLADFADLLEPNPRAMKRLVNAYGFEAKLQLLERDWVEADADESRRLALWTIARLRWPLLADYLVEDPEKVDLIGVADDDRAVVDAKLRPLFADDDVRRVFAGEGIGVGLGPADIQRLTGVAPPEPADSETESG